MSVQNTNLLIYLKQMGSLSGCRAVHCHISGLPKHVKTRDNITRAIEILTDVGRRSLTSKVFLLNTMDLVYVSFHVDIGLLRQAVSNIHKIFGREPVVGNVYGGEDFATIIDIANNDNRLLTYAETLFAPKADTHVGATPQSSVQVYLQVMERIHTTDISTMLLNQPVYAVAASGQTIPVFREMYVSIKALEDAFCPGVRLAERRTLFTELTEHLDEAVLGIVSREAEYSRRSLSLNLNLSAVESKAFAGFDDSLTAAQRGNIVLEFHRNDVVANFDLFQHVAPELAGKGYSLCLDALDVRLLAHLDLKGMHCRFAKLFWSQEAAALPDLLRDTLAERAKREEGVEYILARCDNAAAIRLAKHAGIKLLQGKLIDHMAKQNIPL